MEVDSFTAGAGEEEEPEDEDRWGEVMTTKNAAPSLQAEEAVAATDQEIATIAVHLPCMLSEDLPLDGQCRATDPSKRFRIPCDAAIFFPVERLLARIESDASTIATLRKALPTWISVEERLPEPCEEGTAIGITASYIVLTASVDGVIGTGWVDYLDDPPVWRGCIDPETFEPTHWMNLPEPPK